MKKGFILLIAVLLVLSVAVGCSETPKDANTENADVKNGDAKGSVEPKVIKLSGNAFLTQLEMGELFASEIEKNSNGTLKVERYLESQLGENDEDLITGLIEGNSDILLISDMPSNWAAEEWIGYINVPFAFRDVDHVLSFWGSEVGDEINQKMIDKYNCFLLNDSVAVRGPRMLTANHAIKSVEDMEGLKLRTPNNASLIASWEASGANVTPVPWGELFGALQNGLVDAQENPAENIKSAGLTEVQSHIMITNHQYGMYAFHINNEFWQTLTPEEQEIIKEANITATKFYNESVAESDAKLMKEFEENGTVIIPNEEIDIQSFKEKITPVILEKYDGKWVEGGWDIIQDM